MTTEIYLLSLSFKADAKGGGGRDNFTALAVKQNLLFSIFRPFGICFIVSADGVK